MSDNASSAAPGIQLKELYFTPKGLCDGTDGNYCITSEQVQEASERDKEADDNKFKSACAELANLVRRGTISREEERFRVSYLQRYMEYQQLKEDLQQTESNGDEYGETSCFDRLVLYLWVTCGCFESSSNN